MAQKKVLKTRKKSSGKVAKKAPTRKPSRPAAKAAAKKPAAKKAAAKRSAKPARPAKPAKGSAKKPAKKAAPKAATKVAAAKRPVAKALPRPAEKKPPAKAIAKAVAKAPVAPAKPSPSSSSAKGAPAAAATPVAPAAPAKPSPPIKSFVSPTLHDVVRKAAKAAAPVKSGTVRRGRETQRVGEGRDNAANNGRAFSSDFLARQRAKLLTKKAEIMAMYKRDLQSGQESNDSPTEDIVDRANNAYSRELAFSISDNERELMQQIDQAIARIDGGTYGFCLHTGQPIGTARLEAIPWAKYGVEAQEMLEKGLLSEA